MSIAMLKNEVAVLNEDVKLSHDQVLGFLEFHRIPDMEVPIVEMQNLWLKNGLNIDFLDNIRPVNAFKRATSKAGTINNIEINYHGKTLPAKLLVRNVVMDQTQVLRHLVREVIVSEDEKPYYDSVAWMRFNRDSETMDCDLFFAYESEYAYDRILHDARYCFNLFTTNHTKDTVRNLINKVVDASNPTPIMPNSQGKFIPKSYTTRFAGLQGLLTDLKEGYAPHTDCQIDLIPVVNTIKQREIFSRKAQNQLKELADDLICEFSDYIQKRPTIKLEVAQRMVRNAQDLIKRTNEYEQLMGTRMEIIELQLNKFIDTVQVAGEEAK